MTRVAMMLAGAAILVLVTFANPIAGNVLGFCSFSEGPPAIAVDAIVLALDALAVWMIYRGLRG